MCAFRVGRSGTIKLRLQEDQVWDLITLLRFKATESSGFTTSRQMTDEQHYWEDLANKVENQLREQL